METATSPPLADLLTFEVPTPSLQLKHLGYDTSEECVLEPSGSKLARFGSCGSPHFLGLSGYFATSATPGIIARVADLNCNHVTCHTKPATDQQIANCELTSRKKWNEYFKKYEAGASTAHFSSRTSRSELLSRSQPTPPPSPHQHAASYA